MMIQNILSPKPLFSDLDSFTGPTQWYEPDTIVGKTVVGKNFRGMIAKILRPSNESFAVLATWESNPKFFVVPVAALLEKRDINAEALTVPDGTAINQVELNSNEVSMENTDIEENFESDLKNQRFASVLDNFVEKSIPTISKTIIEILRKQQLDGANEVSSEKSPPQLDYAKLTETQKRAVRLGLPPRFDTFDEKWAASRVSAYEIFKMALPKPQ